MPKFKFPIRQPDVIFNTVKKFKECNATNKVNLSIGVYADSKGKLLSATNEYLSIKGDSKLINFTNNLIIPDFKHVFGVQTCGGTGALSLVSRFLKDFSTKKLISFIPSPSWPNHYNIFDNISYVYKPKYINNEYIHTLDKTSEKNHNILLLQTSCHNPTGFDISPNKFKTILDICEHKDITLILDTAYIGMANGVDKDIRLLDTALERTNLDIFICMSYSKIASMYGQRLGVMYYRPNITNCFNSVDINNNLEYLVRTTVSNPPRYGSDALLHSYGNDINKLKFEVGAMSQRINNTRKTLDKELSNYGCFNFSDGRGMFALLPFDNYQLDLLQHKYNIYVLPNGRINICGINDNNIEYVINALKDISHNHRVYHVY